MTINKEELDLVKKREIMDILGLAQIYQVLELIIKDLVSIDNIKMDKDKILHLDLINITKIHLDQECMMLMIILDQLKLKIQILNLDKKREDFLEIS